MAHASMPYGLLDAENACFEFINAALEQVLARQSLNSGSTVAECLEQLKPAGSRCAQTGREQVHTWSSTGTCMVFCPVMRDRQLLAIQGFALENQNEQVELLEATLDALPVGVWASKPDGETYWFNPSSPAHVAARLLTSQPMYSSADWLKKVHPEDVPACAMAMSQSRLNGKVKPFEMRMRASDGGMHWFAVDGAPVRNADGSVDRWTGVSVDVDRYKATEAQLREEIERLKKQRLMDSRHLAEVQAELSHVQKMELIGQLAGSVAHDFNNLLFVIGLSASQLSRVSDDPQVLKQADMIRHGVNRAARTAMGLMTFCGRQPQVPQVYPVSTLLEGMEVLLRQAVGVEAGFRMAWGAELGSVLVDKTYFENAILNLVLNARDALKGQGLIEVSARNVMALHEGREQPFVQIQVIDNGEGMSEATLARMFDPFFTTKASGKGTGLGMGMVERFAAQAGGFLDVASALDEGSTVSVYLPKAMDTADASLLDDRGVVHGSESIMVLDGDLHVRDAVARLLTDLGYRVSTAHAPEVVLQYVRHGLKLDLILSDIRMSGSITVLEMAQQLEDEGRMPPILFMSSDGRSEQMVDGLLAGRYPALCKPVSEEALSQKIRDVLEESRV